MARLEGKVAIITGGASGMGRAASLLFTREGAAVVVADRDAERGEEVAAECRAEGGRAVFQPTDVTREQDLAGAIERATDEFGGLQVLYNNAGTALAEGFDAGSDDWDHAHALTLRAAFLGMKHAVPVMQAGGGGSIISTSSVFGIRAGFGSLAYSSFKAAIIKLTEAAAQMLGGDNIRVNAIAPGWIVTPLLISSMPVDAEATERVASVAQPIPRAGRPEDIANAALFLASDESSFVSGVCLPVDGGWVVQVKQPDAEAELMRLASTDTPDWMRR